MTTTRAVAAPPTRGPAAAPGLAERLDRLPPWVGGLVGVVVILGVWWLASVTLFQASHAIPTPGEVFSLFFSADSWETTLPSLKVTVESAALGFLWGNLAAILLAFVVLMIPQLEALATQIAVVTYCIPLVAVGPILVIVFGRTSPQGASITLAALSVFFTTVVACLVGLRSAPRSSLDLVRAYGGGRLAQLRKVQLITALPSAFAGLKIAAPAAFLGAVLAEYLGSGGDATMGKALIAAQSASDGPQLWYLALVSGLTAGLGFVIVGLVGRLVTPWSHERPGGSS